MQMQKIVERSKKRLGRGLGSGKGKTGGRGQKGQKARGKVSADFTGGGLPLYKKLPLKRGWGNKKAAVSMTPVPLSKLNGLKGEVDLETLLASNIINKKAKRNGVKIVAGGKLSTALTIKLPVTAQARVQIEAAGGKVG